MKKLIWNTMMSLDGYIAGRDDDMDWVFGVDGGPGETVAEVLRSTRALLVRRRTQDVEDRSGRASTAARSAAHSSCSGTTPRPSLRSSRASPAGFWTSASSRR